MKTVAEVIGVSRSNLAERRQGHPQKRIGRPPLPDEELVAQIHTRSFARDIGLEPRTTPIESPQSNGMAEAFVRTPDRQLEPAFIAPLGNQFPASRELSRDFS
jgi:transposase InsO family protein